MFFFLIKKDVNDNILDFFFFFFEVLATCLLGDLVLVTYFLLLENYNK